MNNRFNKVFPFFDPFNKKFTLGCHPINIFSNCFSFYTLSKQSDKSLNVYIQALDNIALTFSSDLLIVQVVSDASIKNWVATSISHIHVHNKQIIKMIHHTVNVITTKAELFAIRYGINQATNLQGIRKIIVIINPIHSAGKIFDYTLHPFQVHMASISYELRRFFNTNISNTIEFWEFPSWCNWVLHKAVDRETKKYQPTPFFPWKVSWDFSKKIKSKDLINRWKMTFQVLDDKGHNILELLDNENNLLKLTYFKGGMWLKYFGYSNLLCTMLWQPLDWIVQWSH